MTVEPLLTVRGLSVAYGSIGALDDVSIHVDTGEIVSIIGPNGAGKTTLLSAIVGLVRPRTGEIDFRGQSLVGRPLEETVRRGIAMVPEGRHVFAGLTVLENLRLGATIREGDPAVADDIADLVGRFPILAERGNSPAGLLSGGEQQMLVIARALLSRPAFLLLDEPSLGLAPAIVDKVYAIVEDVRRAGVAVLVVEQNAGRALATADRTYILNGGVVRMAGASSELADDEHLEAAYFGLGRAHSA